MKARTTLILMAVAILVPAALIMAAGLHMLLQWERESRLRGVEEAARATALLVDREIAVADASLRGIVNSEALAHGDFARLHREARTMNQGSLSWTLLSNEAGEPLFNTLAPFGSALPHRRSTWALQTFASGRTHVSGYFIGNLTRRGQISVDVPVTLPDARRYVVSQLFDARYFQRTFDTGSIGPDWIVTIFDANGVSLARNLSAADYVGKPVRGPLYAAARAHEAGRLRLATRDGVDVYSVYRRAPLSGWTVAIGVPVDEIEAPARTATLFAALSMLALMGLAIGIAVFLAKRLSFGLGQAQDAARLLGAGAPADPMPPARPSGVREIDGLLADLARSSEALSRERDARERLERERAGLLQAEQAARRLAEAQSQAKDQFLAMLGHELRNPLAAIAGALAVTDMAAARPELLAHAREISRRQLRHLTRIVDDLLDMRRIVSGKVVLDKRRLDAGALLRQCVAARTVVDAGAHAWQVDVPELAPLHVQADETRLGQIFDNLLHNAIKYTPQGGAIKVRAWREVEAVVIEIADTGVGIAAETLPQIFEPLVQGPTGIDRAQGGLGLGLALVRELSALHGGSVAAHSDGPGQGCVFTLRLPPAAA
ncbi:ATP-binding protein [Massilia sp. 9096]|uniref:sensor histidine kinase n=1 Tax=Massilia sp. 9096 TaxID=1500894 RepID=UPI00069183CD|nr:ATP-binding protein [Massilia sp. 9096]